MNIKKRIITNPVTHAIIYRPYKRVKLFFERRKYYFNMGRNKFASRGKKGVIYTCIAGGYDGLIEPKVFRKNVDYVVYTDNIPKNYKGNWELRTIPEEVKERFQNNVLINRYVKLNPFKLFESSYDYAIYIDGNMSVCKDIRGYCGIVQNCDTGIAIHRHYRRHDIYEECDQLLKEGKGDANSIINFDNYCKTEGMPKNSGLLEACVIAVDLHNQKAKHLLNKWFDLFVSSGCLRDQVIFPYVLWSEKLSIEDIANLGDNVYLNPLFKKVPHKPKK